MSYPLPYPEAQCVFNQRRFAHSPAALFQAYAQAERLSRWWGPAGFSNQFEHFEFHPGGSWRFVMHGPDGASYPNECRFVQLIPNQLVHIAHLPEPEFQLIVRLEEDEDSGQTWMYWCQAFADLTVKEKLCSLVTRCNEENFDRLEAVLQQIPE